MAYEPQIWTDYDDQKTEAQNKDEGAVVTSKQLNNIEAGIVANYEILDNKKADKSKLSRNEVLWTGFMLMHKDQVVNLPKALSECENGLLLTWSPHAGGSPDTDRYSFMHIPKTAIAGKTYGAPITNIPEAKVVIKVLYVGSKSLIGADYNKESDRYTMVLTKVESY